MENQIMPRPNRQSPLWETLQQELERVIDRLRFNPDIGAVSPPGAGGWPTVPAINLSETGDTIDVTADMPGMSGDDLDITLKGELLILRGQKQDDRQVENSRYHLTERSYGAFERVIPLGFVPEDDAVTAELRDGMLRLSVRKPPQAKSAVRKVPVSRA